MNRKELKDLTVGLAFISPWIVGFLAFTLIPVGLAFYYSFCDYSLLQPPVWRGTENYRDLLTDNVFWLTLRNTFYYAAMAIPGGLCVSIGLALLLNAKIKGQAIYRTIIFLPSLVPTVASAMLWLWLFNTKLGLINTLLTKIGIEGPGWLTAKEWAMPALALMSLWGVGNAVVIYLAGLQDVPRELYEAAEIDGAGPWSQLWNVTLPMISPVIFFNVVMSIIGLFGFPTTAYAMTQGGPVRATYFYAMYLYDNAFLFLNMGRACAMAMILLLIVVTLTGLSFWTSKRWVHYQGK